MKRINQFAILFLAFFSVSIAAYGRPAAEKKNTDNGKINITTTIFAPYDFVRQIAGEKVNLSMLLPPGAESHSFEPTPQDIITIQNSDIFIYVGGETDKWVARILQSMNTADMEILSMMDTVDLVEEEIVEGMEDDDHGHDHDGEHHDEEAEHEEHTDEDHHDEEAEHEEHTDEHHHEEEIVYDEHVWTSPRNAIKIVQAITNLLCEADSANAEFYQKNATAYIAELTQLDSDFAAVVAAGTRKTIVFGDRFPFRYFADAYGLEYFAAFPGCSTETEPSAATVAFLIRKVRDENIPVVFHIELSNERMADTICEETGAKKLLLHACHNITKRDFDSGVSYLDLMRQNVGNLRTALQ